MTREHVAGTRPGRMRRHPGSVLRSVLPLLTGPGCSDYELGSESGGGTPDTDEPLGFPDVAAHCGDEDLPPLSIPVDPSCPPAARTSFTPRVEWEKTSFPVSPGSNRIMMTPVVGNLSDDNGDGRIDEEDDPEVVVVT